MADKALKEANQITKFIMETGSRQISFRCRLDLDLKQRASPTWRKL